MNKKNKGYDVTNNHDVDLSKGFLGLTYNGGDLGERNNIENNNDIYNVVENIDDFFREHNYRNWKYSFTDFYAVLNYQIPNKHQYEYFKKNKKYEANYPSTENSARYFLLQYFQKSKTLHVTSAFLQFAEPNIFELITKYMESIEKITFDHTYLESDMFDDVDFHFEPEYVTNYLGHKKWHDSNLIIDEMFYDDGKYKNDLDYLLNIRQCTNPKIKFEILNATEKQKKCFESAGLF
jgi:hypothetical protein